jgi:ribose 5-phosphate isomerase B
MRIHLGTDHAGLDFSRQLFEHLSAAGHEVVDHGPTSYDPIDDYPSFCINAALAVVADQRAGVDALGIVFGGSGNGEQIAANKVAGARAALVWSESTALLARQHNDANLIAIGARQHTVDEAVAFIDTFIAEPFSYEERHVRRIAQLAEYEASGAIAGRYVGADVVTAATGGDDDAAAAPAVAAPSAPVAE